MTKTLFTGAARPRLHPPRNGAGKLSNVKASLPSARPKAVVEHPAHLPIPDYIDLTSFEVFKICSKMIRYGMMLPACEFKLLMFILDRTITYKKISEPIAFTVFLKGMKRNDGRMHMFPCGYGESAIKKGLASLARRGAISREKDGRYKITRYFLNPDWLPAGIAPIWEQSVRKHAAAQHHIPTASRHEKQPAKEEKLVVEENSKGPLVPSRFLESKFSKKTNNENRRKLVLNANAWPTSPVPAHVSRLNATTLEGIWRRAFLAAYPNASCFEWQHRDRVALLQALRGGVPEVDVQPFLECVVKNFKHLAKFSWMRERPEVPHPRFVARHLEYLYGKYLNLNPYWALTPEERAAIDNAARDARRAKSKQDAPRPNRFATTRRTHDPEFGSWEDGPRQPKRS